MMRTLLAQRGFHEARIHRMLACIEHHRPYDTPGGSSLFARILHIADDFETLTRHRPGGAMLSPPTALARMYAARGTEYDPELLQLFVNRVGRFPPGSVLERTDGRWVLVMPALRSSDSPPEVHQGTSGERPPLSFCRARYTAERQARHRDASDRRGRCDVPRDASMIVDGGRPMAQTKTAGGRAKLIAATVEASQEARRKRLRALEALIRRRLATVVDSFYDVGESLAEVLREKLYAAGGHASLEVWVQATKLLSVTQAMKLLAIAKHVPREQALAAGFERAYALIALASATPEPDSAAALIEGGTVAGVPAAQAPVRAIVAAAKAQRAQTGAQTPAAKAKAKADGAIERGVRALLRAGGVTAKEVRVGRDAVTVVLSRAQVERALAKG